MVKRILERKKDKNRFIDFLYNAIYEFDGASVFNLSIIFWFLGNCIIVWIYFFFTYEVDSNNFFYDMISHADTVYVFFYNMGNKNNAIGFCYRYLFPMFAFFSTIKAMCVILLDSGFGAETKIELLKLSRKSKLTGKFTNYFFNNFILVLYERKKEFIFFHLGVLAAFICFYILSIIWVMEYQSVFKVFQANFWFSMVVIILLVVVLLYAFMWITVFIEQIYIIVCNFFK